MAPVPSPIKPVVDVITVSYNGERRLVRALISIGRSAGVRVQNIVVDNHSRQLDGSDLPADVHVIRLDSNIGYGAGFNRGLAAANADWVACSNQDIDIDRSAIAILIAAAEDYEGRTGVPCVVAPRLLTPDGNTAETGHDFPTIWQQLLAFAAGEDAARYRNTLDALTTVPTRCSWVSAAFILARTTTFRTLRGFDPTYFMYVEDLDFFDRADTHGIHCVWVPAAKVTHFGGSACVVSPSLYAHSMWNWKVYFARKHGALAGTLVLAFAIVGSGLRAVMWAVSALRGQANASELSMMFARASLITLRGILRRQPPPRDGGTMSSR